MNLEEKLKTIIRDVPDFPKPGILFKDISTIMLDPVTSNEILDYLVGLYKDQNIQGVAGIESRGFLFGYPLAMRLGVPFILIRKEGKLPYKKISFSYELEYGSSTIELHEDAVSSGQRILIHDDLLATGGSAEAAANLISRCGGKLAGFNFLIALSFLNGEEKLNKLSSNIINLARF
ncbi:MAG: adenine phosphoribosyltransferase [Bacteroidetes bacterium]|nr:adenine phosphoribosyltransferase [Bacteroidota bacterium]